MKKAIVCYGLFLLTFGLTLGITVTLNESAIAIDQCAGPCLITTECSLDTGPACTNPNWPYYLYKWSLCAGGPLNCTFYRGEQCGCWNGVQPCRMKCI